jgi:hypothetical protein
MVRARGYFKNKILFLRGAHKLALSSALRRVDYNVEFYPKRRKGSILRFTHAEERGGATQYLLI